MKFLRRSFQSAVLWGAICCAGTVWAAETASSVFTEKRLWRLAAKEQALLENSSLMFRHKGLEAYLQKIAARMWQHVETDLPPMALRVLKDTDLNAYTYANGTCYVTTGMLANIHNEDQLAMIIAHEMVHYLRRHTLAAFSHMQIPSDNESVNAAPGFVGKIDIGNEDAAALVDAAEQQADREGLALMIDAGYCPREVASLLANFNAMAIAQAAKGLPICGQPSAWQRRKNRIHALLAQNDEINSCAPTDGGPLSYLQQIAPAHLANAQAAVRQGLWGTADESIELYLKVGSDLSEAYFLRGEVRRRQTAGPLDQAVACYQKAIDLDETFAPAYRALGVIHFKAGQKQKAKGYFNTFLSLAPQAQEKSFIQEYLELCSQ